MLAGDSAGGGLALAVALVDARPRRAAADAARAALALGRPDHPTPGDRAADAIDPWLFIGKVQAYAAWWAGSPDDLGRPEVSAPRSATWPGCRRR